MRLQKFIKSLLYLVIQLVANESRANDNNARISCLFILFLEQRYISQVIHFNLETAIDFLTVPYTKKRYLALHLFVYNNTLYFIDHPIPSSLTICLYDCSNSALIFYLIQVLNKTSR